MNAAALPFPGRGALAPQLSRKAVVLSFLAGLFLLVSLLSGCAATRKAPESDPAPPPATSESAPQPSAEAVVIDAAKTAIGIPYVLGGTSRDGFDCSGFVQWVYSHVGVGLPRLARDQARVGEAVAEDNLRVGDIVAFRHPRRGYHTGIYAGDGQFIHSPRRNKRIKLASMSAPYFRNNYLGARRVSIPESTDLAMVAERVAAYNRGERSDTLTLEDETPVPLVSVTVPPSVEQDADRKKVSKRGRKYASSSRKATAKGRKATKASASKKKSGKTLASSKKTAKKAGKAVKSGKSSKATKVAKTSKRTKTTAQKASTQKGKTQKSARKNSGSRKTAPKSKS